MHESERLMSRSDSTADISLVKNCQGMSSVSLAMAESMLSDVLKSNGDLTTFDSHEKALSSSASLSSNLSTTNNNNHSSSNMQTALRPKHTHGTMTTRKSVEFAILPPPKRVKQSTPWTAKQVVDAISTSISPHERLEAIQKAKDSFNHDVQAVHDDEMATGVDAALVKHLTFLVYHWKQTCSPKNESESSEVDIVTEISMTCDAMESLYRASSSVVGGSFDRMGEQLVQVIVVLVDSELRRRLVQQHEESQQQQRDDDNHQHQQLQLRNGGLNDTQTEDTRENRSITPDFGDGCRVTAEGDLLLRKATKILGHFARVGKATKPLAHFPGLLEIMIRLIRLPPQHPHEEEQQPQATDSVPWEARLSSLWTLANLACNAENMQMMVGTPGLIDALLQTACRPLHPGDSLEKTMEVLRSRSIAARAILNLSWSQDNKSVLAENLVLIDILSNLATHRATPLGQSRTVREIVVSTRRHAVGALRNLLGGPRAVKIRLSDYKNGHILDVLTDAALNDADTIVKERAFAAIHHLTTQDTAEKILNHPALVLALKDVLLTEAAAGGEEEASKTHASATITVLERSIRPDSQSYETLRELLDAVHPMSTQRQQKDEPDVEMIPSTAV